MEKIFNRRSNLPPFFQDLVNCCPKERDFVDTEDAENAMIYGTVCYIIEKGVPYGGILFLSDEISDYLGFANNDTKELTRLSIKNIQKITFNRKSDNLEGFDLIPEHEYFQVMIGKNTYDFTIAADGTLTLHVTDDGTASGNPIVGATFIRTDSTGVEYGSVITTDTNGDAVFNNVPYAASSAPLIYYKQLSSDGDHEFSPSVNNTSLTTSTQTIEIQNVVGATRTINVTDANYTDLPIDSGTITLTN